MGGGERIRSVRTFMSETVRVHRRGDGAVTLPLQTNAEDGFDAAERVLTHRAAGGFVRIETFPLRETGEPGGAAPSSRMLVAARTGRGRVPYREAADPGAASSARIVVAARTGHGRIPDPVRPAEQAEVDASAVKIQGDEIDRLLREVSLEPRNLLAHVHERTLDVRVASGGGIEVEDLRENALYVFDPRTFLCTLRRDGRLGATTHYLDWRIIAGIATPFVEIRDRGGRVCESRLVGVAYDLPLPASLFAD